MLVPFGRAALAAVLAVALLAITALRASDPPVRPAVRPPDRIPPARVFPDDTPAAVPPGAPPSPAPSRLGAALTAAGYVAIPLERSSGGLLCCDLTIAGRKVRACVDTGAEATVLAPKLAEQLKLKLSDETTTLIGTHGGSEARKARLADWSLGGLGKGIGLEVLVETKSAVFGPHADCTAIIGTGQLRFFSAVLDADPRTPALYLIEPWKRETRLAGEWRATAATVAGVALTAANVKPLGLSVAGDRLTFRTGTGHTEWRFTLGPPDRAAVTMSWTDPKKPDAGNSPLLLRFDADDALTLAMFGPTTKDQTGFPADFTSTAENGHQVITYKRTGKANGPIPAVADVLKPLGYAAVPVTAEDGDLYVDWIVCGQSSRAVIDSGAWRTVLARALVEAAKLTPSADTRKQLGIGGSREVRTVPLADWSLGGLGGLRLTALAETDAPEFEKRLKCRALLGMDILSAYSAVIDYGKPALFLIEPLKQESRLQGKWAATSATIAGVARAPAEPPLSLEIVGDSVTFFVGEKAVTRKLVIGSRTVQPVPMSWVDRAGGRTGAYRFDTDESLTIALCGPNPKEPFPTELVSSKENDLTVVTFRRVAAVKPTR